MEQPDPPGRSIWEFGEGVPLCRSQLCRFNVFDDALPVPGVGGKQLLSPECLPVTAAFPGEGAARTWQGLSGSSSQLGLHTSEGF